MKFLIDAGHGQIVEILLRSGANKEHKGLSNMTPLHGATRYGTNS